jgi:hypothetical protein
MSGKRSSSLFGEPLFYHRNRRTEPPNSNPRTGTFLELLQKRDSYKEYDSLGKPMTVPVLGEF